MELELKHLAAYYTYKLKLKGDDGIYTLIGLKKPYKTNDKCFITGEVRFENTIRIRSNVFNSENKLIPILRPLSDLTKKIDHNGEILVPMDILCNEFSQYDCFEFDNVNILNNPYNQIQKLLEWHFDIYGLIEHNLAIDINTLEK